MLLKTFIRMYMEKDAYHYSLDPFLAQINSVEIKLKNNSEYSLSEICDEEWFIFEEFIFENESIHTKSVKKEINKGPSIHIKIYREEKAIGFEIYGKDIDEKLFTIPIKLMESIKINFYKRDNNDIQRVDDKLTGNLYIV